MWRVTSPFFHMTTLKQKTFHLPRKTGEIEQYRFCNRLAINCAKK